MEPVSPGGPEDILSLEAVKRLLKVGLTEDWRDGVGLSLFHLLAISPNSAGIEYLISQGWNPNVAVTSSEVPSFLGMSTIHFATQCGRTESVTALLRDRTLANQAAATSLRPLHFAAAGNAEAAEILLVMGADPNVTDCDGETPFIHACGAANIGNIAPGKILELLLEKGANPNQISKNGLSPLHLAADAGDDIWVERFLDSGNDVNSASAAGETPLHRAARFDHDSTCRILIERGAEISPKSSSGKTPLSLALERKATAAINVLLEHGATGTLTTAHPKSKGEMHLSYNYNYLALESHRDEQACNIVRALILAGGDIQAKDEQSITPLHVCFLPNYFGSLSKDISGCYSDLL